MLILNGVYPADLIGPTERNGKYGCNILNILDRRYLFTPMSGSKDNLWITETVSGLLYYGGV